ncbi:MAG: hypothetical protein HYZ58_06430 [Acidobacteria bacterium]|nr:hypothetical protein [Acidobacteriota bacterium]
MEDLRHLRPVGLAMRLQAGHGMAVFSGRVFFSGTRSIPRGFSATEAAMVISAVSLLGAVAKPVVSDYVNQARLVRAHQDAHTIGVAFLRFADDVGGQARTGNGWATQDLLVGDGEAPALGVGGDPRWLGAPEEQRVGSLADHLVTNDVKYGRAPGNLNVVRAGWRGPYIENGIGPDPWGHRYEVNVKALAKGGGLDTIVISAGPNGVIETAFEGDGLIAGGDDIVALVSSGG